MYNADIAIQSENSIFETDEFIEELIEEFDSCSFAKISKNSIDIEGFTVWDLTPFDFFERICQHWPNEKITCTAIGENLEELDTSYSPPYYEYENISGRVYCEGPFVDDEDGNKIELCDLDDISINELW